MLLDLRAVKHNGAVVNELNNQPRKRLGFHEPTEHLAELLRFSPQGR